MLAMLADAQSTDLLSWALIGVAAVTAALTAAVGALWRSLINLQGTHAAKIEALQQAHLDAQGKLVERYHEAVGMAAKAIDALTDALDGGRRGAR